MQENRRIIQALQSHKNEKLAIATIVHVEGSAYRKEGAKLLAGKRGVIEGTLSGGCLEPDVVEISKKVIETGKPQVKMYDLDEDLVWGLEMGCPGKIYLFIEPLFYSDINRKPPSPFQKWMDAVNNNHGAVLCTILNDAPKVNAVQGERLFIKETAAGRSEVEIEMGLPSLKSEKLKKKITSFAKKKLHEQNGKSSTEIFTIDETSVHVFFDVQLSPNKLVIFGAGQDAIPLNHLAIDLGFKTIIIDPRNNDNNDTRFPRADCRSIDVLKDELDINICSRTFIVIMNHHLSRDRYALGKALKSQTPYIGVLGSKVRITRMVRQLIHEGQQFSKFDLAKLYGPVGLDIGANNGGEIALSIMAEILAVKNERSGRFLREMKGPLMSPLISSE